MKSSTQFDPYRKWLGIAPADQPPNHYRLLGLDLFESVLVVPPATFPKEIVARWQNGFPELNRCLSAGVSPKMG
jgi:hypothetical protein